MQAEDRIMQLETQLAQMSALVREDPLTRSLNRRGLEDEFAREASRADRYKTPFCIAVLDIDNFKALNDKRGHQTGDEALIHLVKVAKEELRLTDHIARLGGEEFLIMLPNTPLDEATQDHHPPAAQPHQEIFPRQQRARADHLQRRRGRTRARRRAGSRSSPAPTPPCTKPSRPARTACACAQDAPVQAAE